MNRDVAGILIGLLMAVCSIGRADPPLDGIWATAPYLHNGSVPTLAALLDSDAAGALATQLRHVGLRP